jgi:hypothetical protein
MTLLDMQRVLSRILTDRAFQDAFIAGADPPASYALSAPELRSLRGLRWDRVSLHTSLLAHGRLELALKALPLTTRLLESQLYERLDRFCAEYPPVPQPGSTLYLEATRISAFALGLLRAGVLQPGWAADVIVYERTLLTLALSEEAGASASRTADLNMEHSQAEPGQFPGNHGDFVPVAGPHAEVISFSYPIPDLIAALQAGGMPGNVQQETTRILFHKAPRAPVHVVRISTGTVALLEACDGSRTVAGVLEELSGRFGSGIDRQALAAMGWLRENNVICLRETA